MRTQAFNMNVVGATSTCIVNGVVWCGVCSLQAARSHAHIDALLSFGMEKGILPATGISSRASEAGKRSRAAQSKARTAGQFI